MGVPKKKISRTKRDIRRKAHPKMAIPNSGPCPQCGEKKLPHRVCRCGFYNGREVFTPKSLH